MRCIDLYSEFYGRLNQWIYRCGTQCVDWNAGGWPLLETRFVCGRRFECIGIRIADRDIEGGEHSRDT